HPHRPVLEERDAPHGRMGDDRDAARARLDAPRVLHGGDARGHTRPREVDRDDIRLGVRGHQREPGPRGDGLRAHQRRHARQGQGAKSEAEKGAAIHAFPTAVSQISVHRGMGNSDLDIGYLKSGVRSATLLIGTGGGSAFLPSPQRPSPGRVMTTATQPLTDVYNADPVHSSFGFAVVYQGSSTFRGTFDEVSATLVPNTN